MTEKVLERVRRIATGTYTDELAQLTAQEQKILMLVAEGKTNKEIAEEVFLSDKTVKNYVSSILSKLNLERRAQAAAFVARHRPPISDYLPGQRPGQAGRSGVPGFPGLPRASPGHGGTPCTAVRLLGPGCAPPAPGASQDRVDVARYGRPIGVRSSHSTYSRSRRAISPSDHPA